MSAHCCLHIEDKTTHIVCLKSGSLGNRLGDGDLHAGGSQLSDLRNSPCGRVTEADWAEGEVEL